MVVAAKGLQFAKPELGDITVVWFAVMDDGCGHGAAFGCAEFAQRVAHQVMPSALTPAAIVVWATAIVAASSRIQGMRLVHGAHENGCWHGRRFGARFRSYDGKTNARVRFARPQLERGATAAGASAGAFCATGRTAGA